MIVRKDMRSNEVYNFTEQGIFGISIQSWQWGNDVVHNNIVGPANDDTGGIICLNQRGVIRLNQFWDILGPLVFDNSFAGVFQQCTVINLTSTVPITASHALKTANSGYSNFEITVDITGLTTIDLSTELLFAGIINLTSSNATETINIINELNDTIPVEFRPADGLIVTFTGTPIASITTDGEIIMPTSTLAIDGSKGENVVFRNHVIGSIHAVKQIDANNSYL